MGYESVGLGIFTLLSVAPAVPIVLLGTRWLRAPKRQSIKPLLLSIAAALFVYAVVWLDAFIIEPNWPVLTTITLDAPIKKPLTILHLSDLHLEQDHPRREQWLVRRLADLKPDLIVLTGDIHQMENFNADSLRQVLSRLRAPLGVFGCVGFDHVSVLRDAAPNLRMLVNEAVVLPWGDQTVGIAGLTDAGKHDAAYAAMASADFRIILNHTPDLIEEAAKESAHLYLCGHTHGGQVRIPFWGAIITNTDTGKRYEAGPYSVGEMHAYTSRGLGLEPSPAPPVRFFCRPEIIEIRLVP
ncbi:MAG: metallophosphoesterase family protein [Candidatus Hydrogenedentes bacterium]|nr:metallophosphoesterase family protein [Candidatus Hydrogenedentota bacterium]